MTDVLKVFRERMADEWLPAFCGPRAGRGYAPEGFRWDTVDRVGAFDAGWFMTAIDLGLVAEHAGFFMAPRSGAKEQIFSTGSEIDGQKPFTLWLEPVITIGALARLHIDHGWPGELLGCQPGQWALDLVAYGPDGRYRIGVEVKKTAREIERLLGFMRDLSLDPELPVPSDRAALNAYRKVVGIRRHAPPIFWALGPGGKGEVFRVAWCGAGGGFDLIPALPGELEYRQENHA